MSDAVRLSGVQSLAPNNPSVEISLPAREFVNQRVWFHWSGVGADFQLCNESGDTAGVPVASTTVVSGPFLLSNAPRFCYTGDGATTATCAVMVET